MCCKGFVRHIIPFFITFAVGLFIASFFVTIATPSFSGFKRNPSRYREFKRVKTDIEELRLEKYRLENEIESLRSERRTIINGDSVTPIDGLDINTVPPPPPASREHRGLGSGSGSGSGR